MVKKGYLRYGILEYDIISNGFIQKFVDYSLLYIEKQKRDTPGITKPFTYIGQKFTPFLLHREDIALCSISYLYYGEPKIWYVIDAKYYSHVQTVFDTFINTKNYLCPDNINHKLYLPTEKILQESNIKFTKVIQNVGDCIILNSNVLHFGYNCGLNFSVAVNFLPPIKYIIDFVFKSNTLRHIIKIQDKCNICSDQLNDKNDQFYVFNIDWKYYTEKINENEFPPHIKNFFNNKMVYYPIKFRKFDYIIIQFDDNKYIAKIIDYLVQFNSDKNCYNQLLKVNVIIFELIKTIFISEILFCKKINQNELDTYANILNTCNRTLDNF